MSFLSVIKPRQEYRVMAPKNWKLGECSEIQKLSVFGGQMGPKLKQLDRFYSREECRKLAIKKPE